MEIRTPTPRVILSVTGERIYVFVGSTNVFALSFNSFPSKLFKHNLTLSETKHKEHLYWIPKEGKVVNF